MEYFMFILTLLLSYIFYACSFVYINSTVKLLPILQYCCGTFFLLSLIVTCTWKICTLDSLRFFLCIILIFLICIVNICFFTKIYGLSNQKKYFCFAYIYIIFFSLLCLCWMLFLFGWYICYKNFLENDMLFSNINSMPEVAKWNDIIGHSKLFIWRIQIAKDFFLIGLKTLFGDYAISEEGSRFINFFLTLFIGGISIQLLTMIFNIFGIGDLKLKNK